MASAAVSVQTLVSAGQAAREAREAEAARGAGARRRASRRRRLFRRGEAGLRPRGVGEILDTACEVLTGGFGPCVGIALALWLPARALTLFALRSPPAELAPLLQFGLPQTVLQFAVQTMIAAMLALYVCERIQGRDVSFRDSVALGLQRALGVGAISLIAGLLSGVAAVATCVCLGLGGYVVQWLFAVAPAAYVIERSGVFASLGRSAQLVGRSFWRWLGWFVVMSAMLLPLATPAQLLDDPRFRQEMLADLALGGTEFDLVYVLVSALFLAVSSTFTAILVVVFYVDTRVRREGLDLALDLERLAGKERAA